MSKSLKQRIKQTLFNYPELANKFYKTIYLVKSMNRGNIDAGAEPREGIFDKIYETNYWANDESVSGPGSSLRATEQIRASLPRIFADLKINTLLDAPCGDFNWMAEIVEKGNYIYIGGDIVTDLVQKLNTRFKDKRHDFIALDLVNDPLPDADVWMCRDCFIHLPMDMIKKAFGNFARSNITYLLTTQYDFPRENVDIPIGRFRYINLQRPPFGLPKPTAAVFDYQYPYPPRKLALWHRDQIPVALRN